MLTHPMLDQLTQLGLSGMAQAFTELETSGEGASLTHADWLGLLVDREVTHRRDKRLAARLRYARLRHHAVVEDVDYRAPRGLDRALFHKLAAGDWIDAHDNLIARRSISVFPSSSPISPWRAATDVMPASCEASTASSS